MNNNNNNNIQRNEISRFDIFSDNIMQLLKNLVKVFSFIYSVISTFFGGGGAKVYKMVEKVKTFLFKNKNFWWPVKNALIINLNIINYQKFIFYFNHFKKR